jgi:glycosidase
MAIAEHPWTKRAAALATALSLAGVAAAISCAPEAARTSPSPARLELREPAADIWAFQTRVEAVVHGRAELRTCVIAVGTRSFPARVRGGAIEADVELAPGDNTAQARCETADRGPLRSAEVLYHVPLRAAPTARAQARVDDDGMLTLDGDPSTPSEVDGVPLVQFRWSRLVDPSADERAKGPRVGARACAPACRTRDEPIGEGPRVRIDAPTARAVYALHVTDQRGRSDDSRVVVARAAAAHEETWLERSVVYGVLPRLYGTRGLRDVTDALDSLASLGVGALWIAPAFVAAEGDYGYAVRDYFQVRADYGGSDALRELIDQAHLRGLRVILDLPANHTSSEHRYFVQASQLRERSHYFGFYDRDAAGEPTHYFDWVHLPNLSFAQTEVARFMQEVGAYWVRELGADGYRVDAAWGVRARNPEYWPRFNAELRRINPEVALIAEASARDPYYLAQGFDAAYDWTDQLGHHAWEHVFSEPHGIAVRLDRALRELADQSGDPRRTLRFLNNNDSGARFISRHGAGLTRVATAALLTLPGIPCLYSFDEVGAEYEPYSDPLPVRIQNPELREFHARWIGLRANLPVLRTGALTPLHVSERDEAYVFARHDAQAYVLVLLNFAASAIELSLELPSGIPSAPLRDALSGARVHPRGRVLELSLAGWEARVLVAD